MAHALEGYDGLCRNIHGHTYHLRITLIGKILDELGHPKNGFVIDFTDLKNLVQKEILNDFDHTLVLHESSKFLSSKKIDFLVDRILPVSFQPTCENLLIHFVSRIKNKLPDHIELNNVRLDETPSSYAEWFLSDQ